jgi:TRAP-type C4-dicarboxylate transport system substrate-binding protein
MNSREEQMRYQIRCQLRDARRTALSAMSGLALAFSAAGTAQAETIKLLSSWAENDKPAYANALLFKKNVEAVSGGKIKVEISGPEVVPPFQQLQPVSAGVFDVLYTHGAYHAGAKGLALGADAINIDVQERRDAGVWRYIDEFYQKNHKLKLLSLSTMGTQGYHCYIRQPLSSQDDWKGRKIRGVVSYHGVIRALGGEPVVLPIGEIYSALERGVVDGACMPAAGMLANKHYEVAKYRMEPTFGSTNVIFAMNMAKWQRLSSEQQKLLLEAGAKTEKDSQTVGDEIVAQERAELAKAGVKVEKLPPEKGKMIQEAWDKSQWELAQQCCGQAGVELHELARKAGLAK